MKSSKHVKRLAGGIRLGPDRETDERILAAAEAALSKELSTDTKREKLRLKIMRNPIIRIAVAAVIGMACLIGLSLWRTTGSGIALADVLARIEKISAYRYQWSFWRTGEYGGKAIQPNESEPQNATTLISDKYGCKVEKLSRVVDADSGMGPLTYVSIQEKVFLTIWPEEKKYARMEFDDAELITPRIQGKYNYLARGMVKRVLGCKYESMGRATIDSIEVEGFRTTDPNYASTSDPNYASEGKPSRIDVRIWVDVKTGLPVRSEEDMTYDKETLHYIKHNFQWDVAVDAAEFVPVIPDDYTLFGGTVVRWPAMTEETAIQGLRRCVELFGKYPESIRLEGLLSALEKSENPAALRLKGELERLSGLEKDYKRMDALKGILYLNVLNDSAYYGKTVTPKDADKVLMRWQVSDNEYRVIYGDLHAETVTAEKLAELEKALSK